MSTRAPTRFKLDALNPPKRATIDSARSGNQARDGYAVLDQARPRSNDEYGYPSIPRQGLARRVYDGPKYED